MVVRQGEVWWAELPEPAGSEAGFRRPVLVVQGDGFNRSRIATVVCVPLTSNLRLGAAPGNLVLPAGSTGLPRDSVANMALILAVNRRQLMECVGEITDGELERVFLGIDLVLGRS